MDSKYLVNLAYVAGIVDGEGSIFIARSVANGRPRHYYSLKLNVSQNDTSLLYWLKGFFNVGGVSDINYKTSLWITSGKDSCEVIRAIRPFLKVKGNQADLGTYFQQNLVGKKWARTSHQPDAARKLVYEIMRVLNQYTNHLEKVGELLGYPNVHDEGNQQPSQLNVVKMVDWKVQRLMGEELQTNNPDTSAHPERDDIVRACARA